MVGSLIDTSLVRSATVLQQALPLDVHEVLAMNKGGIECGQSAPDG
jgi:hypothetical protein